jgi:hypothetical protein
MHTLELLALKERVHESDVLALDPVHQLVACDFYVLGIETGAEFTGGYRRGRILNVDHHAPTERMRRAISSTNLALACIEAGEAPDPDARVVINHLDCDSILSSGLMTGRLEPESRFGDAAIAADHTGGEDPIADLLQGMDGELSRRGIRDADVPFASLARLLNGEPLDALARDALQARQEKRAAAESLVARGGFHASGGLRYAVIDAPTDGEFFPALLPDATLIMVAYRSLQDASRWQVRLRLGLAAPDGFSLADLGVTDLDSVYGGRWNAGSNRRGGGTALEPETYAHWLAKRLEARLAAMNATGTLPSAGKRDDNVPERYGRPSSTP